MWNFVGTLFESAPTFWSLIIVVCALPLGVWFAVHYIRASIAKERRAEESFSTEQRKVQSEWMTDLHSRVSDLSKEAQEAQQEHRKWYNECIRLQGQIAELQRQVGWTTAENRKLQHILAQQLQYITAMCQRFHEMDPTFFHANPPPRQQQPPM